MAPIGAKKSQDKTTAEIATDLWQLVRDYAKQETLDPLKTLGRFLGYGLGGAVCLGVGVVLGTVGLLRLLQTETGAHLTGSWSWVPYLVTLVITVVILLVTARAITKPNRADGARS